MSGPCALVGRRCGLGGREGGGCPLGPPAAILALGPEHGRRAGSGGWTGRGETIEGTELGRGLYSLNLNKIDYIIIWYYYQVLNLVNLDA